MASLTQLVEEKKYSLLCRSACLETLSMSLVQNHRCQTLSPLLQGCAVLLYLLPNRSTVACLSLCFPVCGEVSRQPRALLTTATSATIPPTLSQEVPYMHSRPYLTILCLLPGLKDAPTVGPLLGPPLSWTCSSKGNECMFVLFFKASA